MDINTDRERIENEMRNMYMNKRMFDKRKAVKQTFIKVGDMVKIRSPRKTTSHAGSKFLGPMRVIKVFRNAISTEDHRIWNLNRIAKVSNTTPDPVIDPIRKDSLTAITPGKGVGERRKESTRIRFKPRYLDDFVQY